MKLLVVLLFVVMAFSAQSAAALEVTLKNGEVIECEHAWRKGDTVFVQVNPDTLLELNASEIVLPVLPGEKKNAPGTSGSGVIRDKKDESNGKPPGTPPTTEEAVVASSMIVSQRQSMESFEKWCSTEFPPAVPEIRKAIDSWSKRNDALLRKASLVLRTYLSKEERESLVSDMEAESKVLAERLSAAPRQSRVRWCREVPAKILSADLDPSVQDPAKVKVLQEYRVPGE